MKKFLSALSGAAANSMFYVGSAFAALPTNDTEITGLNNTGDDPAAIKAAIIDFIERVLDFVLIIAIVYVVVAGLRLIVSGGDEGEKDKTKTTIIYVLVGIVIVLFARVIVLFVNNLVG
jgi:succinate dehydrogenase/fumarate reductase cytochrome b subunit